MKSTGIKVTQSQRLQLNASLRASIRLLRTDASGLTRYLEEQAAENPALRLEVAEPPPGEWLPRWHRVFDGTSAMSVDHLAGAAPSMMAHVTAEIGRLGLDAGGQRIALALAEALEPSGWLGSSCAAIAAELALPEAEVLAVLARLQGIDPAGLFARNLRECLELQARDRGLADPVLMTMLGHLDLVARAEFDQLAQIAAVSPKDIAARFSLIRTMDPKPGSQFSPQGALQNAVMREPDLLAERTDQGWTVRLNRSALPSVSVAPGRGPEHAAARSLVQLVQSRNATLLRIGEEILRRQHAALDQGLTALRPMTMAEVAQALDLHESTVSRVVAGTAVDTPLGTWWLRRLFGGRRGTQGDTALSAAGLKAQLAQLVAQEDPADPLSDEALCARLQALGAQVGRRSVARYREAMNIPPAHRRRRNASMTLDDRKSRIGG